MVVNASSRHFVCFSTRDKGESEQGEGTQLGQGEKDEKNVNSDRQGKLNMQATSS